ncbi:MAG TPA: hypothetical protein VMA98_05305 [Candidatus Acidoferrales bacterium]|nr:hypothetical protein [Candidatus Acidoferrales bacterium]
MFIASLLLSAALERTQPTQSAYTSANPIQVAACSVSQSPLLDLPFGSGSTAGGAETAISFVNTGSAPVTSVVFAVSEGNQTTRIVDKGTFSNGITVKHTYLTPEFGYALGDVSCNVQSVAFADGTTWQAQ